MKNYVVIQCNSMVQLYFGLAVALTKFEYETTTFFLKTGEINGRKLEFDFSSYPNIHDFNSSNFIKARDQSGFKAVVISASHLPLALILKLGPLNIKELIRVEEGIGSYGSTFTKLRELFIAGYPRLLPRHLAGILASKFLENTKMQKAIFLFDGKLLCNARLLTTLRFVISELSANEKLASSTGTLVLSSDYLSKHQTHWPNAIIKEHPAWGKASAESNLNRLSAEEIIYRSDVDTVISEFSSTSVYAPVLFGSLSVCFSTKTYYNRLSRKQKELFDRYCEVIIQ